MAPNAHPPVPGPFIQPNFRAVMEAVGDVTFPISKRELIDHVGDDTVVLEGRNTSLHDVIKDIRDDYFESESEFLSALETEYALGDAGDGDVGPLPGALAGWPPRMEMSAGQDRAREPGDAARSPLGRAE